MTYRVTIELLGHTYTATISATNSEEARARAVRGMIKRMQVQVEPIDPITDRVDQKWFDIFNEIIGGSKK